MNILPGNLRFGAGKSVKRLEDPRLLTGKGQFIDDKPEDGALWLHMLRSPHAHARIVSMDTIAAPPACPSVSPVPPLPPNVLARATTAPEPDEPLLPAEEDEVPLEGAATAAAGTGNDGEHDA